MIEGLRVAIIVSPQLSLGLLANTVGAISIGLGAKRPVLADRQLSDNNGHVIDVSSRLPVPILQAEPEPLKKLMMKALECEEGHVIVPFPSFARKLHDYNDYEQSLPERSLEEEVIDGVGLAGPEKWVRSLTGSLKLLR
ncbi:DUF2000 domain-containing protein [uncultured Cohaesibacter sp.]|uniref:DUF2000 domain-containing protein n=1 Tax=uncultured Cohaesibacter sp. TaxID=1002546 RepID=UPI0029302487|nr:DUF2000 domain-containing protein [uncultured Cohaesibacter sp.]